MATELTRQSTSTTKSSTNYQWVILFLYDEDTEFPFSCVPLVNLENTNFPFRVIDGSMDASIRREPIALSYFGGEKKYCVFAKIEEGIIFNLDSLCFTSSSYNPINFP